MFSLEWFDRRYHKVTIKSSDNKLTRFEYQLCYLLTVHPWARYLVSLCLNFLICKVDIITVPTAIVVRKKGGSSWNSSTSLEFLASALSNLIFLLGRGGEGGSCSSGDVFELSQVILLSGYFWLVLPFLSTSENNKGMDELRAVLCLTVLSGLPGVVKQSSNKSPSCWNKISMQVG